MDEHRFLIQVYRESGDQVRNISTLRNTFLSFYVVALAAFIGLLAQRSDSVQNSVWAVPLFLSAAGFVSIFLLWPYTHTSLRRQELITRRLLPAGDEIADDPRPTLWRALMSRRGLWNLRIEFLLLAIYGVTIVSSSMFWICGDPFGLTGEVLKSPSP